MTEGPLSAGTLTVRIVSDAGNLSKDVERQVNAAASGAQAALDKATKSTSQRARSIGAKSSLLLTAPILLGAKAAINAASDIVESTNKVGVVFGQSGKDVLAWSETTARSFGISKREALDAAGTFGNLFRAMGIGEARSATLSKSITELAGDMASFNNADPSDVLLALRSGLVGEVEPLRKFGVNLNQSRIEAEAYSLGLVKATKNQELIKQSAERVSLAQANYTRQVKAHGKESEQARAAALALQGAQAALNKATKGSVPELTAAQKAQASYSLIMQDTKLQQGDFGRSLSTSAANQERVNKALADNAKSAIGEQLLPAYHKMLIKLGEVADKFDGMPPVAQKLVVGLALGLAALGPVLTAAGNVKRVYDGLNTAAGPLVRTSKDLVGGFRNVNKAYADNASLGTRLGAAIRAQASATLASVRATTANVVAQVRQRVATIASTVAQKAAALASKAWAAAQWLLNAAMSANPIVLVAIALAALVVGLIEAYRHSETFRKIVQAAFGVIKTVVMGAVHAVWQVITTTWRVLSVVFRTYFNIYKTIVLTVFRLIQAIVRTAVNVVRVVITTAWRIIRAVFMTYFNIYKAIVLGAMNAIRAVITAVMHAVRAVITTVLGAIRAVWNRIWHGLTSTVSGVFDAIRRAVSSGIDVVKGLVDKLVGFFTGLPGKIKSAFTNLANIILGPFKAAFNAIAGFWNSTLGAVHFETPGWLGPLGHKGFSIPKMPTIKGAARGGRTITAGAVLVGEIEPEIVELPAGASVVPLSKMPQQRSAGDADRRSGNTIIVQPAPGMDELGIARLVDRELEWAAT